MVIAAAIKTKSNEIYASRKCHAELLIMYPDKFKYAEQGFLTSDCKFVDRKEALIIAMKNKQIKHKTVDNDELYSEDIFLEK